MAKRKLNKQQRNRIAENLSSKTDSGNPNLHKGLVVTHYGKEVEVIKVIDDRPDLQQRQRCHLRANLPTLVCGDFVMWQAPPQEQQTGVIEALLERRSVIARPRPYQDPKPVAANIDLILLVIAVRPEPIANLIDRYLIAAENANIEIAIALNKTDLLDNINDIKISNEIDQLLGLYKQLGYPVYKYHALNDNNDNAVESNPLYALLKNKTSILVGQSGVGKSSIINTLTHNQHAAVGNISSTTEKGKHTTTTADMFFLHADDANDKSIKGSIIDSPGIREFGLWHLSDNDIIYGLREFYPYTLECKFRDCEHGVSQGCALQAAFDSGKINPSRISSYQHILNSRENR